MALPAMILSAWARLMLELVDRRGEDRLAAMV